MEHCTCRTLRSSHLPDGHTVVGAFVGISDGLDEGIEVVGVWVGMSVSPALDGPEVVGGSVVGGLVGSVVGSLRITDGVSDGASVDASVGAAIVVVSMSGWALGTPVSDSVPASESDEDPAASNMRGSAKVRKVGHVGDPSLSADPHEAEIARLMQSDSHIAASTAAAAVVGPTPFRFE
jgi:hypothetical protein